MEPSVATSTAVTCYKCGQQGHRQRECITCYRCGERHHIRDCPRAAETAPKVITCYRCGAEGHGKRECTSKACEHCGKFHSDECYKLRVCSQCCRKGHDADHCHTKQFCSFCHTSEHFLGGCPRKGEHWCELCGEEEHVGEVCTNPNIVATQGRGGLGGRSIRMQRINVREKYVVIGSY